MLNRGIVHQDFGSVEERFADLAGGGREFSLLLAAQEEVRAALARVARVPEEAAIEVQDVLMQADEALVLG